MGFDGRWIAQARLGIAGAARRLRHAAGRCLTWLAPPSTLRGKLMARVAKAVRWLVRLGRGEADAYKDWIRRNEPAAKAHADLRAVGRLWERRPKVSVVMPTFNTPEPLLRSAIESVRGQVYENWELCIADDASSDGRVRQVLGEYARADERVRVVYRDANGHISAASNTAIEVATGDYIAFLDHDDELHPLALHFVVQALNDNPGCALVYTDEDKIGQGGRREEPYFKCDFNPELMLAQNLIGHLATYDATVVRALGGLREAFVGSQDYDLALRVVDKVGAARVAHIPRVLYHWRKHAGSTALAGSSKPYAFMAAQQAVREHLQRTGRKARVVNAPDAPGMSRVVFEVPLPAPSVTLIVPTRDRGDLLQACLGSVFKRSTYPNLEVLVVDNGSSDPATLRYLSEIQGPRCRVIRDDQPFNFSRLCNLAVGHSQSDYVCLLNNDTEVISPGWVEELVSFAAQEGIGAVGARLWYPDGTLQHGGVVLGVGGVANHSHSHFPKGHPGYFGRAVLHQSFSAVTGACLLVRRQTYLSIGGMDEALGISFNDVDFCLRLREAGYRNVWTPYAELWHHESASRGNEGDPAKNARFSAEIALMRSRWGPLLDADPAYSPNLTLSRADFSIRA